MAKAKKLWNVAGFSKTLTDVEGVYRTVDPLGDIVIRAEEVSQLLDNGFTDEEPEELVAARKRAKEIAAAQKKGEEQAAKEIVASHKRAEKMRAKELLAEEEREAAKAAEGEAAPEVA